MRRVYAELRSNHSQRRTKLEARTRPYDACPAEHTKGFVKKTSLGLGPKTAPSRGFVFVNFADNNKKNSVPQRLWKYLRKSRKIPFSLY